MARAVEIMAIGLGQAGGNLAAELYRRGYRALAVNTAETDLSALAHASTMLPEEALIHVGLGGSDGAGADIAYARACIENHADQIREFVAAHLAEVDIILLTAGLGGGTGSAICELIRVLAPLDVPIITLTTLPGEHESSIAKVNAVRAVNELVKQEIAGWLFVDNARLAEQHGDISLDRYFPAINRLIMEPLDALNNLNRRDDVEPIRSLDGQDIYRLLSSHGVMSFLTFSLPHITTDNVLEAVREGLLHHSIHPQGYELEYVTYMGIVIEAPEAILDSTKFATFEHIHEQLKRATGGAAIMLGVYRVVSRSLSATVRVFASSQSLPDGIRAMVGQAQREGKQLHAKLSRELSGLELGEIESFDLSRAGSGVVRRQPSAAATPPEQPEQPERPAAPDTPRESVSSRPRPPSVPPPPPLGPLVSHSAYEALVREYKATGSSEIRQRVMTKLQGDYRSENPRIRHLAAWALTELANNRDGHVV
ncbi:MAG: hypothetical protein ABW321_16590 [Polyangiales bacterium]